MSDIVKANVIGAVVAAVVIALGTLGIQTLFGGGLVRFLGGVTQEQLVPGNAVVAFNQDCPPGWTPFEVGSGRFIVGAGTHDQSLTPLRRGLTGGARTHVLLPEELPPHTHTVTFSSGRITPENTDSGPNEFGDMDITEESGLGPGRSTPHNNMPPYVVLEFCVRQEG